MPASSFPANLDSQPMLQFRGSSLVLRV